MCAIEDLLQVSFDHRNPDQDLNASHAPSIHPPGNLVEIVSKPSNLTNQLRIRNGGSRTMFGTRS